MIRAARQGPIRREPVALFDLDAIRREHPLSGVVGAVVPLKRAGGELKACCPLHSEKSPSFTIYSGGERWHCFGCGAGGDVFDFLARLHGVGLRDAADMLTGGEVPTVPVSDVDWHNRHDRHDSSDRADEARAIWLAAAPATGTPAESYLRSRGLHLPVPGSIRFTRLRYGAKGPEHPVLVAAVVDASGEITGIQRTYLNAAGTGKAAVPKPKLSLGRVAGGAIRVGDAAADMVVAEGLEDGISLAQELHRAVWVAPGTSFLPLMRFPPGVVSVAIGGDNDPAGRAAALKAAESFALRGLSVRTFFPADPHKDFNDQLQKGARP